MQYDGRMFDEREMGYIRERAKMGKRMFDYAVNQKCVSACICVCSVYVCGAKWVSEKNNTSLG